MKTNAFLAWAKQVEGKLLSTLGRDKAKVLARKFGARRLKVLYRARFTPEDAIGHILSRTKFKDNPLMMVVTNPGKVKLKKYSSNPVDIRFDKKSNSYEVIRLNSNPGGG